MILALLLALATANAGPRPDDIDRFISICVDGGKELIDRSGKLVDRRDVPEAYLRLFGRPRDKGASTLRYFTVDQGGAMIALQQYERAQAPIRWACTLATGKFDVLSARRALLERLDDRGIRDVTGERFLPSNLTYEVHENAYSNPIMSDKIAKREQIDRFTLQTADPNFEIFGRNGRSGNLYWLSVLNLNEGEASRARRAWGKCQKADCSLSR